MFHKIKSVHPLPDYKLYITFMNGETRSYNVIPLFAKWPAFRVLQTEPGLFEQVKVDSGGYGIIWNDEIDLEGEEVYWNGTY